MFRIVILVAIAIVSSGCAGPVVLSLTLNELSTATSLVSTALTGKGLGDHALGFTNGEDCRVMEGLLRKDRKVCEPIGAPETDDDFKGLVALLPATRAGTGGEVMLIASDLEQGERP